VSAATRAEHPVVRRPDPPGRPSDDNEMIAGVARALAVLRGKWKVHLLFSMARGVHRHGGLLECLPGASKKVMTDALRSLERDGLVERTPVDEVPARVEYSLTALGWTMTEPLIALSDWGATHGGDISHARTRYREAGSRLRGSRKEL
jgi:DNA-binding HxlR family transcriptional regulator